MAEQGLQCSEVPTTTLHKVFLYSILNDIVLMARVIHCYVLAHWDQFPRSETSECS